MSSTLISRVEEKEGNDIERLHKELLEAKSKGATHFTTAGVDVIQFRKELSPVEILESRMTALRSDYSKTFEQYQKEVGGICPKCNIAISKGGGCINHKDCPMKPII